MSYCLLPCSPARIHHVLDTNLTHASRKPNTTIRRRRFFARELFLCCSSFLPSIYQILHFARFVSPSPSLDVTQIRGHKAGSSPPSPLHGTSHHFFCGRISHSYFLPSSTRVKLCLKTRCFHTSRRSEQLFPVISL